MLNATNAPFDVLMTPLNSTTRQNMTIDGMRDVTILSSGFVGMELGSSISIGVSSLFTCIRVFRMNTGYVVCISSFPV